MWKYTCWKQPAAKASLFFWVWGWSVGGDPSQWDLNSNSISATFRVLKLFQVSAHTDRKGCFICASPLRRELTWHKRRTLWVNISSNKCTPWESICDVCQLLHVSTPRVYPQGVITKVYKPTCEYGPVAFVRTIMRVVKVSNCARVYRLEHNYIVRYIKISQLHVSALTAILTHLEDDNASRGSIRRYENLPTWRWP